MAWSPYHIEIREHLVHENSASDNHPPYPALQIIFRCVCPKSGLIIFEEKIPRPLYFWLRPIVIVLMYFVELPYCGSHSDFSYSCPFQCIIAAIIMIS